MAFHTETQTASFPLRTCLVANIGSGPRGGIEASEQVAVLDDSAEDSLGRVVLEQLQNIPGVLSTKTFPIFEDAEN